MYSLLQFRSSFALKIKIEFYLSNMPMQQIKNENAFFYSFLTRSKKTKTTTTRYYNTSLNSLKYYYAKK